MCAAYAEDGVVETRLVTLLYSRHVLPRGSNVHKTVARPAGRIVPRDP
jgi:hypothetical protein